MYITHDVHTTEHTGPLCLAIGLETMPIASNSLLHKATKEKTLSCMKPTVASSLLARWQAHKYTKKKRKDLAQFLQLRLAQTFAL